MEKGGFAPLFRNSHIGVQYPALSFSAYAALVVSLALEICLLACLVRRHLWRRYFSFFLYVLYELMIMDFFLLGVWTLAPQLYRGFYWNVESISVVSRFLVLWEIFRQTFPRGFTLSRLASRAVGIFSLGLWLFSVCVAWSVQAYSRFHSPYPALERGIGLAQALLTLAILLLARYYGIRLGRNVWGMAVGFGAYVSATSVSFVVIDLYRSFVPSWQLLAPLSFDFMLAVWAWALWTDSPNPKIAFANPAQRVAALRWWEEWWGRTLSTLRKVMQS